jgi:hypothetical protein
MQAFDRIFLFLWQPADRLIFEPYMRSDPAPRRAKMIMGVLLYSARDVSEYPSLAAIRVTGCFLRRSYTLSRSLPMPGRPA